MDIIKNYIRERLAQAITEGKEYFEVKMQGLTREQQDNIQAFVDGVLNKSSDLFYDRVIVIYTID